MTTLWHDVSLGDVLTTRQEKPSEEDLLSGRIRIVSKISFADGRLQFRSDSHTKTGMILVRPGDLLVSGINAYKGAIAVYDPKAEQPAAATIHYSAYEVRPDRADPRFVWYLLRSGVFRENLEKAVPGGIKTELKASRLLRVPVSLPPLAEQRRIAARIDELATKIEDVRRLRRETIEEANAVVEATARRMLAGVDATITELRFWLHGNGEGIQTGPFGAQLGRADFVEFGVPVLTIGNVQYKGLKLNELKYVSEEKARGLDRYRIKSGDILFARMGTVGRCCIVPEKAEGWLINYHIIRVALDKSRVEPRYIHWTIRASADVEEYLSEKIRGATRQGVNSSIVGSLPCRVPAINEQRRIVAYLDGFQAKVDPLKGLQNETAAELDALLPSILDKAFKGDL